MWHFLISWFVQPTINIDFITVLNRKKAAYSDTVEAWAGECLALGFISSPELFLIN